MENIVLVHLQNAKAQIKAEEDRQVAIVRERILRDIQPKYVEIDKMKTDKLNQLSVDYSANRNAITEQYNSQLSALQSKLEEDRKVISDACEKKKNELLASILATETYKITRECDKAIARLDAQIKEIKEK